MRPLVISGRTAVQTLQEEIQRSEEARYDHRLHGVLLVAQGVTCPEVAALLGDAPRSVEYWVHRFQEKGLVGLLDGECSRSGLCSGPDCGGAPIKRTGRPTRIWQLRGEREE